MQAASLTGSVSVYQTDQSATNCTGPDAGTNPDHNFAYFWTSAENYSDPCSTDYSGAAAYSSSISAEVNTILTDSAMKGVLNYNRDGDMYFTPYSHDAAASVLGGLQAQIYMNLSASAPKDMTTGNLFQNTVGNSSGSLLDLAASSGLVALDIGIGSENALHTEFVYQYLALMDYILEIEATDITMVSTTDNTTNITTDMIQIVLQIQQLGLINLTELQLIVGFNDTGSYTMLMADATYGNTYDNSTSVGNPQINNKTSSMASFLIHIDAFGLDILNISFSRTNSADSGVNGYVNLVSTSYYFPTVTAAISTNSNSGGGSSGGGSSTETYSDGTDKTTIIIASGVLIGINVAVIIVAIIWKCCKSSENEPRRFGQSPPAFQPKAIDQV